QLKVRRLQVEYGIGYIAAFADNLTFVTAEISVVIPVVRFAQAGFECVEECNVTEDHPAGNMLRFARGVVITESQQVPGPGARIVHKAAPYLARFPPPVIRLVVVEADEKGEGGTQYGGDAGGNGHMLFQPVGVHHICKGAY